MMRNLTPLRVGGIALALLWPFVLRPLAHLLPLAVIPRTMLLDVVVLGIMLLILRAERIDVRAIGLRRPSWQDSLWAIGIAIVGLVFYVLFQHFLPGTGSQLSSILSGINLLVAIPFVLIVGVTEELTFRGYLIGVAASNVGLPVAFVVSTLVFGFAHATVYGLNATLLAPLVLGAVLAGFYVWRRNLTACILGHALIDYIGLVSLAAAHAH